MEKIQELRRKPRRASPRSYVNLLKGILVFAFIVFALYYFSQSSFFSIQEIAVKGMKRLSPLEISKESGLCAGMNIFQLNLGQAKKRLLTNPWIESAELGRQFPRTVQIVIKERQPSALLLYNQRWLVLDQNGVCIEVLNSLNSYSLPIITGLKPDTTDPGKQVSTNPALKPVLAALDVSVENFFSEINISAAENLVAYTREGIPVFLGKCESLHSKLLTAQSLTSNFNNPGAIVYVNLRSVQAPAVKYLETGSQKNEKL